MRGRRTKAILIVAALLPALACQSPLDVATSRNLLPVTFEYGVIRTTAEAPFVVVQTNPLILRGYFETPCSPYSASASARVVDSVIVVQVTGGAPGACFPALVDVGYQISVTVDASAYSTVKVVHIDGGRAADTVFRSGRSDSVAIVRDTSALLQTSTLRYAFTGTPTILQTRIPYTYRNVLADTLYIQNCNAEFGVVFQRKQGDAWVTAWSPILPLCLSQPIVIPPGGKYETALPVVGARPGRNFSPEFPAGNLDGVYRLVMSSVVLHYQSASALNVSEKYRTSNSFFLDDPQ